MKKHNFLLLGLFFLMLSTIASAQQLPYAQQQKVDQLFKKSSVVYFKFTVRSMQEVSQFNKVLSVDKAQGATVFAHANKPQFTNFMKMNYAYKVLPSPQQKKKTTTTTVKKTTTKKTTTTTTKKPVKK